MSHDQALHLVHILEESGKLPPATNVSLIARLPIIVSSHFIISPLNISANSGYTQLTNFPLTHSSWQLYCGRSAHFAYETLGSTFGGRVAAPLRALSLFRLGRTLYYVSKCAREAMPQMSDRLFKNTSQGD